MQIRMLTPEKLGKVFDVPEDKARDLIARGQAEAVKPSPIKTASQTVQTRGSGE